MYFCCFANVYINGYWEACHHRSRSFKGVDVDVEDRRAQAYASMPASYICELNLLITNANI